VHVSDREWLAVLLADLRDHPELVVEAIDGETIEVAVLGSYDLEARGCPVRRGTPRRSRVTVRRSREYRFLVGARSDGRTQRKAVCPAPAARSWLRRATGMTEGQPLAAYRARPLCANKFARAKHPNWHWSGWSRHSAGCLNDPPPRVSGGGRTASRPHRASERWAAGLVSHCVRE
jgi:hypothetical protein